MKLTLCAPCLFGLEGPLGNELRHMDMENVAPENGRVYFTGDESAVARANIRSRFAERVLIVLGRFPARSFDELFEGVRALPWEAFIPADGAFPVKGWALESALHSVPDCQKIVKKAVVERLKSVYGLSWFSEEGESFPIQFAIMKDEAALYIDTSGTGLHKRGYRPAQVAAPLRETLAAAIVDIARYRGRGDFCDPFCGSGTIAIEAALAALNRAPGLNREFAAETWRCLPRGIWQSERNLARSREYSGDYHIFASDIDPRAVALARENARRAGVDVQIEIIPEKRLPLSPVRERLFQGVICSGAAKECLDVFRAESPYLECMGAAERIRFLLTAGCRCRDITVVCTDMTVYQPLVNLVFHRLHIPVYQSGTEDILQKSVIATVLMALDAALSGFDQKSVLRYLRSALSPVDPDTCDRIENYAIIWGIRGQKWAQSWENHPDGLSGVWTEEDQHRLEELNTARELAIAPLTRLWQGFRDASDLRGQILALYGFLEDISLEMRLSRMAQELDAAGDNRAAQILNQLWEILLGALEQMYDMLGGTHWEGEQFIRLFRLLLSQYDVGTIPPVLDAVQVGPVSAMRCHQEKHLIVLGAEEGKLPGYSGSAGVLTDQERVTLRELGVPLTGGAMEGVQAEFAEIYGCFCGAMASVSVFCSGDQPSFVYRRLCELAGGEQQVKNTLGFAPADGLEAGAYLARWDAGDAAGRLNVRDTYLETCRRRDYRFGKVERETIGKLYGSTLNLSASQIDRQAECRLSYFLKYGLRVQERKEAAIDPAEFGTYVHAVLENSARRIGELGGFHKVSLEETLKIAHGFSEEYAREHFSQIESERVTYLFRRHIQELDMVVRELWQELSEAAFAPAGFEVGFGDGEGLPPIPIPGGGMNAVLRGFIDRVDIWDNGASRYYRVVDYKTGKKDFDYCDVFNGVGLQMLLYMFALKSSGSDMLGDRPVAAGVQYFPARAPYLTSDGKLTAEEAEQERISKWKRKGLLLNDEDVLQAMEPGDAPKRMCYSVKKDGTISGDLADRQQLKLLEGYVFRILSRLVEDIVSGNVEPNPYTRGSTHDACRFCPYGPVCHPAAVEGRRSYKMMDAQRFWEEIGKEMGNHGG